MKKYILLFILLGTLSVKALQNAAIDSPAIDPARKTFRSIKNEAFKPGEKLTFRLHYGIISAGEGTLEVLPDKKSFGGRTCYEVVGTGRSVGAFDWFFKVRDRYESTIDSQALIPWYFVRRVNEGGYTINQD